MAVSESFKARMKKAMEKKAEEDEEASSEKGDPSASDVDAAVKKGGKPNPLMAWAKKGEKK